MVCRKTNDAIRLYGNDCGNRPAGPSAIETQEFDLLLCNMTVERERDGYTVVRAIRDVNPRCLTIILTEAPHLESAIEGSICRLLIMVRRISAGLPFPAG
jgi:hypothetical protein